MTKKRIAWNKGTKGLIKPNSGSFKKGERRSIATEFTSENSGENSYSWKGDKVGYGGVHIWARKTLGDPLQCVDCGSKENVQWANISKKYKRRSWDWKGLCASCHRGFDGIAKLTKAEAELVRVLYSSGHTQIGLGKKFGVHPSTISHIVNHKLKFYG